MADILIYIFHQNVSKFIANFQLLLRQFPKLQTGHCCGPEWGSHPIAPTSGKQHPKNCVIEENGPVLLQSLRCNNNLYSPIRRQTKYNNESKLN